jgi:hypothetical protein
MLAAPMALAGCTSGGSDPVPATTVATASLSPSSNPSPSVAAPQRPNEMSRTDKVGAEAAARYFLALYPYVLATGDFTEWDAMVWETCTFCSSIKTRTLADFQAGAVNDGGGLTLYDFQVGYDDFLKGYPVLVRYTQAAATLTSTDGRIEHTPGETGQMQLDMAPATSGWKVLHVSSVKGNS